MEHAPEKGSHEFFMKENKRRVIVHGVGRKRKENFPDVGNTIELIRIYPHWFNFSIKIKNNHFANRNRMQ